jgi:2-dehydropantoate 2-reductase
MSRIAIVGPGAIGGTLAGNLQRAGHHEIFLCGRRESPEVTLTMPDGHQETLGPVIADWPVDLPALDWVLVATKTYAAEETGRWLEKLMSDETRVAIFQNGVEHRERFQPWVADERLVPVVIDCPAERPSPDAVVQRGTLKIVVGRDGGGAELKALFAGADEYFQLTDDFLTAAWRKLTLNSVAVLTAATLRPNVIFQDPAMQAAARGVATESVAVARAAGANLDEGLVDGVLAAILAESRDGVNSLLADRLAKRPTELAARNGAIVRIGKTLGVPTPLNEMGVALVDAQIRAEREE